VKSIYAGVKKGGGKTQRGGKGLAGDIWGGGRKTRNNKNVEKTQVGPLKPAKRRIGGELMWAMFGGESTGGNKKTETH